MLAPRLRRYFDACLPYSFTLVRFIFYERLRQTPSLPLDVFAAYAMILPPPYSCSFFISPYAMRCRYDIYAVAAAADAMPLLR